MLTKIRITNFKCFEDTGEMKIRPLTLFFGPNSSGKSSILQLLLALKQTIESNDPNTAFVPNGLWVQLGSYPDFVFQHEWRREVGIEVTFSEPSSPGRPILGLPSKFSLKIRWCYNRKTTQIQLAESLIENEQESVHIQRGIHRYRAKVHTVLRGKKEDWEGGVRPIGFYNFLPLGRGRKGNRRSLTPSLLLRLALLHQGLAQMMHRFYYLGPLREFPQRSYVISGQAPSDVGVRGEQVAEVLWFATRAKERRRKMLEQVNYWMREFGIAKEIRLQRLGKSNQYQVLFVDPTTELPVNIADVGFGSSQLLPIIVQGFYTPPGSVLLVEQPEIHLHPRAQAILGDLLMEIVKQGDRQIIVETHSEHLLARIQRRIAERQFQPQQVAIYYFEPTQNGTKIHRVELNSYGQFEEPIPEGFFEEGWQEALGHIMAIGKRKAEEQKRGL